MSFHFTDEKTKAGKGILVKVMQPAVRGAKLDTGPSGCKSRSRMAAKASRRRSQRLSASPRFPVCTQPCSLTPPGSQFAVCVQPLMPFCSCQGWFFSLDANHPLASSLLRDPMHSAAPTCLHCDFCAWFSETSLG